MIQTRLTVLLQLFVLAALAGNSFGQISGSDNFNDNSRDVTKWSTDFITGNGVLNETNQRLEYRVTSPDLVNGDEALRAWVLNPARYTNDWEVILEVANTVTPTIVNQIATIGIEALNAADLTDYVYVELYASALGSLPFRRGFKAGFAVNDLDLNDETTGRGDVVTGATAGAVRLVFNAQTKTFTTYYSTTFGSSYQWVKLGSFGVAGSGGSITNGNWNKTDSSTFQVAVYGFSQGLTITAGQAYGDNFFAQTPTAGAPTLISDVVSNSLRLRWPAVALPYELESAAALNSGSWSAVTNLSTVSNGTNTVILPLDNPARFFRLRR